MGSLVSTVVGSSLLQNVSKRSSQLHNYYDLYTDALSVLKCANTLNAEAVDAHAFYTLFESINLIF